MTGLVGWWPLNGVSGKARDLSGNGNHGTLHGGVVRGVAGRGGITAYWFLEGDEYVNGSTERVGGKKSISFWLKPDFNAGDDTRHWAGRVSVDGNNEWLVYQPSGGDYINLQRKAQGSTDYIGDNAKFTRNEWLHYTLVDKGTEVLIYKNGELKDQQSVSNEVLSGSASFTISPDYRAWRGGIQDFRIYNRVLSPSEISTLYEWGSSDSSSPPGSRNGEVYAPASGKAFYRFNGDFQDSWNGKDGSNNGATFSDNSIRGSKSVYFDGSSFVDEDSMSFSDQNSYTFSVWVLPDSQSSYGGIVAADMGSSSDNYGLNLRRDSGGRYEFIVSQDTTGMEGPYTLSENTGWYNLVAVYDSQEKRAKLYSNGRKVQDEDATDASFSTSNGINIGRYSVDSSSHYNYSGLVDNARIYSRALKPREISELYRWGTRGRDMRKLTVNARGN